MRYALTNWNRDMNPFNDFDRAFEGYSPSGFEFNVADTFKPAVDVEETDKHYILSFDLPGINKDDIKIEYKGDELTVSGERKIENKKHSKTHRFYERNFGRFERVFQLPEGTEAEKIEADYRDGILTLAVAKKESPKSKVIPISEGKSGFFDKILGKGQPEKEVH